MSEVIDILAVGCGDICQGTHVGGYGDCQCYILFMRWTGSLMSCYGRLIVFVVLELQWLLQCLKDKMCIYLSGVKTLDLFLLTIKLSDELMMALQEIQGSPKLLKVIPVHLEGNMNISIWSRHSNYKCQAHGDARRKRITIVIWIYHLGTTNVCTKFHGNISNLHIKMQLYCKIQYGQWWWTDRLTKRQTEIIPRITL